MGHAFEPLSSEILAAAVEVHTELGPGFLESVYENAMRVALRQRGIEHQAQKRIAIFFRGEEVGMHRLDLMVDDQIVVEIKAIKNLEDIHFAQVKSYLKATKLRVGLLLNFQSPTLIAKRVVFDE